MGSRAQGSVGCAATAVFAVWAIRSGRGAVCGAVVCGAVARGVVVRGAWVRGAPRRSAHSETNVSVRGRGHGHGRAWAYLRARMRVRGELRGLAQRVGTKAPEVCHEAITRSCGLAVGQRGQERHPPWGTLRG